MLAGKDDTDQGFTRLRVFLPRNQAWVCDWFFNTCLVHLLQSKLISCNRIVIIDGDTDMYKTLRTSQVTSISSW